MTDSTGIPGIPPPERGTFCNRTLNMRAIKAIGYDMDYTLIHYKVDEWERRAYAHLRDKLAELGWPVEGLTFDPDFVIRGLIIDTQTGNIVKCNRFGYVKLAYHGTQRLDFETQRRTYMQALDLTEDPGRYKFLDTLFAISEACMYAQLVDLLDARRMPDTLGYAEMYRWVRRSLDEAHMEGQLKAGILADPDQFVEVDPLTPLTLLDQRKAGKRLMLITNSGWSYTREMMAYAFDPHLPDGMTWRELFDVAIVSARKPTFFADNNPMLEVVDEEAGLLRPANGPPESGRIYVGGSASRIEDHLGLSGSEILYVGDHIFVDVLLSKNSLRWRTALVLRELESELIANVAFQDSQRRLTRLMSEKEDLELEAKQLALARQRQKHGYGPAVGETKQILDRLIATRKTAIAALDDEITPLARAASGLNNPVWGLLLRTGNDKSYLARQIERHADIYMSRVSNLMYQTPFAFLRSPRGSLPHDMG